MRISPALLLAFSAGLLAAGCASAPGEAPAPTNEFGFRDPTDGRPEFSLTKSDRKRLDAGLEALRAGDRAGAARAFRSGANGASGDTFRLALVYTDLAAGRYLAAREGLDALLLALPDWTAAVEARADLDSAEGRTREALEGYRRLRRLVPEDARSNRRCFETQAILMETGRSEAEGALGRGDLDSAWRAAAGLVELDPSSPVGFRYLARTAAAAGKDEDALAAARTAHGLDPDDVPTTRILAELARKTERYGEALSLYSGLAAADPAFREKADEALREFQIHNLPDAARRAAQSPRLTRAQFAALVYALVPEVRAAPAVSGFEVAVDALDRPERTALVKAIHLGFFTVSHGTHTVGADTPLLRTELAVLLKQLASLIRRRGGGCLWAEKVTPATLGECGILQDTTSRYVTGNEALMAIEAAVRAAREGNPR